VLTKADLCADITAAQALLADAAGALPVVAISAAQSGGLEPLVPHLAPGRTAVLLGSSGVGKSTLVNALLGQDVMATGAIREDDAKGRHTTRHRELFRLPTGALLIDTPGLREFGLSVDGAALDTTFSDVTELIGACRFSDCSHQGEPGCAIEGAMSRGALSAARWGAYQKLMREQAFEARRADAGAQAAERAKWKKIHKGQRAKAKFRERQSDWD
jgi:ribosome biogenesis GTPase